MTNPMPQYQKVVQVHSQSQLDQHLNKGWELISEENSDGNKIYLVGLPRNALFFTPEQHKEHRKKIKEHILFALIQIVLGSAIIIIIFPGGREQLFGMSYNMTQSAGLIIGTIMVLLGLSTVYKIVFGPVKTKD